MVVMRGGILLTRTYGRNKEVLVEGFHKVEGDPFHWITEVELGLLDLYQRLDCQVIN